MHEATYIVNGKNIEILCEGDTIRLMLRPDATGQRAAGAYGWFIDHYREIAEIEEISEPSDGGNDRNELNDLARVIASTKSPAIRLRGRQVLQWVRTKLEHPIACKPDKKVARKSGFVYIIEGQSLYKIGRAKNVRGRMNTFTLKLPFPTRLVGTIKSDDYVTLERQLHTQFAARRMNGEWFVLTDSDLKEIENMPDFVGYSEDK